MEKVLPTRLRGEEGVKKNNSVDDAPIFLNRIEEKNKDSGMGVG